MLAGPTNLFVFLGETRHLGDFGPPDKNCLKQDHVILLCFNSCFVSELSRVLVAKNPRVIKGTRRPKNSTKSQLSTVHPPPLGPHTQRASRQLT